MKFLKIAATTALLVFGLSLTAQAKDNFEFHEDQWKNVAVYEKRTIADDSVSDWGQWVEVAPTAAGGPGVSGPAIGFAPPAPPAVYRPVAEVTAPVVTPARVRPPRPCRRNCN